MMASEMTSAFRVFALKKLNEAKEKGASLATATAATAASLTSNVPAAASATSFVFRSNTSRPQDKEKEPLPLDRKLTVLKESNAALKKMAMDHPTETLDNAINKVDLINESMAFTIENIQECSHVMKMMHRQLRDLGSMGKADDLIFYKQRTRASTGTTSFSHSDGVDAELSIPSSS